MLKTLHNKKGIALMTTLFFLIIVTTLATGAIMLSTVQMKVSGSIARWESALSCAEGGISYSIQLLQYVHYESKIPQAYCAAFATTTSPCVPAGTIHTLVSELQTSIESSDVENLRLPAGSVMNCGGLDVSIDIDATGTAVAAGGGAIEPAWAYHNAAYSSGMMRAYRITSTATTPAGTTRARINQVFWLRAI